MTTPTTLNRPLSRSTNVYEERGELQSPCLLWVMPTHSQLQRLESELIGSKRLSCGENQEARYFRALALSLLIAASQLPLLPLSACRKYVIDHLLPQIAFDLWPIVLATGAICVVERNQLLSSDNYGWFTIWHILFEVTSGYATVGVSFGTPYSTASFSGSFRKISKLIVSRQKAYRRSRVTDSCFRRIDDSDNAAGTT